MSKIRWQPGVSLEILRRRAGFFANIREFFNARGVLEVDTPVLSQVTATDPHLDSFWVPVDGRSLPSPQTPHQYLLTSPEHAMKRLLATGCGPIFQLTRAFRHGEVGRLHNPEFAMLEWYRPGWSIDELRGEVQDLLAYLGYTRAASVVRYREVFEAHTGLHPFRSSEEALKALAVKVSGLEYSALDFATALDVLMSHKVEPALRSQGAVFVTDYPAHLAALAKTGTDEEGNLVAKRFELYLNGIEIANAYDELTDASEQRYRFEEDNRQRVKMGKAPIPVDEALLAALPGLPDSSGIALGLDRLLMVLTGKHSLQDVLPFPHGQI